MKAAEELWNTFYEALVPKDEPSHITSGCKLVFMAGAYAAVNGFMGKVDDEAEAARWLKELEIDLISFFAEHWKRNGTVTVQ